MRTQVYRDGRRQWVYTEDLHQEKVAKEGYAAGRRAGDEDAERRISATSKVYYVMGFITGAAFVWLFGDIIERVIALF